MTEPPDLSKPSRGGCLLALALLLAPLAIYAATDGSELSYEMLPLLLHGVILALPFGYLALDGTRAWLPWLVVIGLTVAFWGAYIGSAIIGARNQTGVNIGMGLVMLAAPFIISFFAWAAVHHTRRP